MRWFGLAEWGSATGCPRVILPAGTWITRFSCRWPTGNLLRTNGRQVRPDQGPSKGAGGVKCSPKVAAVGWVLGQPPWGGMLGVPASSLPPWEGKGHPASDAEDPKIRARRRRASSSSSLPTAGILWGHWLMSPLRGDLEMGISSHHIPSAGSRWFFGGML